MTLILDLDETLVHSRCVWNHCLAPVSQSFSALPAVAAEGCESPLCCCAPPPTSTQQPLSAHTRSVKPIANYDWQVSVPASGEQRGHTFFVAVRPHVAMFLRAVSKWYEVVVFTASLQVLPRWCAPKRDREAEGPEHGRKGGREGHASATRGKGASTFFALRRGGLTRIVFDSTTRTR